MKKSFIFFLLTFFAASLFAQEAVEREPQDLMDAAHAKKQLEIQKLQDQKLPKIRKAEKGMFAAPESYVNSSRADEVIWINNFESTDSVYSVDLTEQPVYGDTSYMNPYAGDFAWWVGTVNEFWDYPVGYGDNWRQVLVKETDITLEGTLTSAGYKYALYYNNEGDDFDFLLLEVSSDGGTTWETLEDYQGTNTEYTEYTTDLTSYIGQTLKLRWYFFSDGAYSSADGNDFTNGAFWLDNSYVVKDGTETLFDDGGDTMVGFMAETAVDPLGDYWEWVDRDAHSPTHSFQTVEYTQSSLFALVTEPIDLTDIAPGYKLTLDFWLKSQGLVMPGTLADEDYWYVQASSNGGATWNDIDGYVWQDFPEWTSWAEVDAQYGFDRDLSAYAGEMLQLRWVFRANPATADQTDPAAGLYIDDPMILIGLDPNEPNNNSASATQVDVPYYSNEVMIAPANDADYYMFYGEAGQFLNIMTDNSLTDTRLVVYSAGPDAPENPALYYIPDMPEDDPNYDPEFPGYYSADGVMYDQIFKELHYTGWYMLIVRSSAEPVTSPTGPYTILIDNPTPVGELLEVKDVTGDQGLQVRLKWNAADLEMRGFPEGYAPEFYSIERRIGAIGTNFDFVKTVPSKFGTVEEYYTVVPTLEDGKNTGYRVLAHYTDMHRVWESNIVNGQSVDNLTPEFLNNNAAAQGGVVEVDWDVDLTIHFDVTHYEVYRSTSAGFEPNNDTRIATLPETQKAFTDDQVESGTYFYVVAAFDDGGNIAYSDEMSVNITSLETEAGLPTEYGIEQNYPNPFNPATTIRYALPHDSNVNIKIYNSLGQQVAEVVNSVQNAGFKTVNFNASSIASGIYFYVIKASAVDGSGEFTATKKMMLLK